MKTHCCSKKNLFVALLCAACIIVLAGGPAIGAEMQKKTINDPRDVYLDLEGLCGCEGMPYEYTTPPEKHIKTKIDKQDLYLDMEALCGCEGMPYHYLILPSEYIKVKHDPKDLQIDVEKMLTEDPSTME